MKQANMKSASRRLARLVVVATTAAGLVLVTASQASARICVDPSGDGFVPCPSRSGHEYAPPVRAVTDDPDWAVQWMLLAAAVLGALAIVAVVADVLVRRRWRQAPVEAALAFSDPAELPRAAGLLGERLALHRRTGAAEHAYRAAIDVGDEYWTPIAQVALANLLSNRGEREEARALLEAAVASGNPRAVPAARSNLDKLLTGNGDTTPVGTAWAAYESLNDATPANR